MVGRVEGSGRGEVVFCYWSLVSLLTNLKEIHPCVGTKRYISDIGETDGYSGRRSYLES